MWMLFLFTRMATMYGLLEGFQKRLEAISTMLGVDVMGVDINFNFNRPQDNKSMLEAMKTQYDMQDR